MNRTKLKNILKALDPMKVDFGAFDNELTKLKDRLTETVTVKTLEDVGVQLERFKKKINFEPLTSALDQLKANIETQNSELLNNLNSKQTELSNLLKENDSKNQDTINGLQAEIAILSARKIEIPDFGKQIKNTETKLMAVIQTAKDMDSLEDEKESEQIQKQFLAFEKQIKDLKQLWQTRGGGSMNRQIKFNGVDRLTRYTDINYKAGSNVTFTIANNDQTKMVDVTIAATGGGGGTVRIITSISTNTAAGSASGTDYVYLCTGTLALTLPDATASNTNLYTIKNVGTGVVTINTTSSQTIDGALTQIMPVQFTSIDVISDTANWSIT